MYVTFALFKTTLQPAVSVTGARAPHQEMPSRGDQKILSNALLTSFTALPTALSAPLTALLIPSFCAHPVHFAGYRDGVSSRHQRRRGEGRLTTLTAALSPPARHPASAMGSLRRAGGKLCAICNGMVRTYWHRLRRLRHRIRQRRVRGRWHMLIRTKCQTDGVVCKEGKGTDLRRRSHALPGDSRGRRAQWR